MSTSIYNKEFPSWLEWHADTGQEGKEPQQIPGVSQSRTFPGYKDVKFYWLVLGRG